MNDKELKSMVQFSSAKKVRRKLCKNSKEYEISEEKEGNINDNCEGDIASPISEEKMNNCYKANGVTYPLCKGEKNNKECDGCNLYENMVEPCDNL